MAHHIELGRKGEDEACLYLARHGYTLLHRNWRYEKYEVDIIADYFGEIVFVEVKTRSMENVYTALDAVDREKRHHVVEAAKAYMAHHAADLPYRFDIISVVGRSEPYEIRHYRNAFRTAGSPAGRF